MAINHLNTLAQYHTNYMFKVELSRELISHPSKKIVVPYKSVLGYPYQ